MYLRFRCIYVKVTNSSAISGPASPESPYDYIIIGSGIAGLNTALLAANHGNVLVITKGRIDDCNSRYAQGGIAAAIGPGDSPTLHQRDTLDAGAGLCDPAAVAVLTGQGPDSIASLIQWGVPFDTIHGEIALGREGAHSLPRILHAGGDATGQHIEDTLADRVRSSPRITVMEFTHAISICVDGGAVSGVETIGDDGASIRAFRSSVVVVSTGGAGRLYEYTTNPEVATGDGVALAFLAGADVMDMEFYQFHPTALWLPGAPTFLLSEAMRGEGAILRNAAGSPFMADYHPMADLAPRDVVSRAMAAEMEQSEGKPVTLDISHLSRSTVAGRFPTIYAQCLEYGVDITREPIPVAPAAHYMMGGIHIDTWGRTNISGLYACGEVACSAVHGANRLASNSLLDTLVFSQRLVECSLGNAPEYAPRRCVRAAPPGRSGRPGNGLRLHTGAQPRQPAKPDVAQRRHYPQRDATAAVGPHPEPVAAHDAGAGDCRRLRAAQYADGGAADCRVGPGAAREPGGALPFRFSRHHGGLAAAYCFGQSTLPNVAFWKRVAPHERRCR